MSVEILLPALSPTMESGKIVNWHKNVGDSIKSGEIVFEVETDKAVMEVEATDAGVLACIIVKEGECKVGNVVAVIATKNENIDDVAKKYLDSNINISDFNKITNENNVLSGGQSHLSSEDKISSEKMKFDSQMHFDVQMSPEKNQTTVVRKDLQLESVSEANEIKKISPLAKSTAFNAGLSRDDLFSITGSGQNNRVVKKDVNNYVEHLLDSRKMIDSSSNDSSVQNKMYAQHSLLETGLLKSHQFNVSLAKDAVNATVTVEQPSKMRQSIAQSLTRAVNEIPTFSMSQQCIMDDALTFVQKAREVSGIKISLNDFIIKSCAFATNQVKVFNTFWKDDSVLKYASIDIGFAVAVKSGVVVRVLRNALNKNISEISIETKLLSDEAREKNMHENYVFCVSNMGGSGVESFSATLSGTAILAVGSCYKSAVVVNDEIHVKQVMNVCLTCDHRLIDGIDAANWMKFFKIAMSNPSMILLG